MGRTMQRAVPGQRLPASLLLCVCLLFLVHGKAEAEEVSLTLREAVSAALGRNLGLEQERKAGKISEADITAKEGVFDPLLRLEAGEQFSKSPSPSLITGAEQRVITADAGIGGKITTGTIYELKWTNERFRGSSSFLLLNPYYRSELTLSIAQPLLKGFGSEVQESDLNVARNTFEISKLRIDEQSILVISETMRAYWDLISARDDQEVAELSLRLARNILEEVRARIEAGVLAPVEIYNAEAEVSLREEGLLGAKKLVSDAEDRLRTVMNAQDWSGSIVPAERPSGPAGIPALDVSLEAAMEFRQDLRQARVDKKSKDIVLRFSENQLLPDLSIVAQAGLNGLNGSYGDTIDKMGSGSYYSWQLGLAFSIPLGNRTAKGNMLKARYDRERADTALLDIELKVKNEVRESWRSLRLASERIEATRKTRIAAEKRMEAEEGRFKVGMATLNDVLRFQEEYARALSSERRASADYAKAVVSLERAKGTLTEHTLTP